MKICVAQAKLIKGDIPTNIENHQKLINLATSKEADLIIFPELSLTGYEPDLAKDLATHSRNDRFNDFQKMSDSYDITIGVGMPIETQMGVQISMLLFQPSQPRQLYSKKHLHPDEYPFFVSGENYTGTIGNSKSIALAICYELSVPQHAENAFTRGAEIYIASVAKTANGIEKANESLTKIAKKYSMTVLMANCIGPCDGDECGGKSAIWNNEGELLGQLDSKEEGILMIETETGRVFQYTV